MIKSLRDSKAHLSELVERASRGEEIVITVRGKPKARLGPVATELPARQTDWGRRLKEARSNYTVKENDSSRNILDDIRGDRA